MEGAHALVVGAGALGCAAAQTLAASGVGRLSLVDDDCVELSNLQRQVLFDRATIGRPKATAAAESLARIAPSCEVAPWVERLAAGNVERFVGDHDVVVDASDDPETKYLLNRAAIRCRVPLVYGGVARTGGMALLVDPGRSACLACAFPAETAAADDGCDRLGILAPVAGLVGTLEADLALRALLGDRSAAGILFVYELRGTRWRELRFARRPDCDACVDAATRAA